MAFDLIEQWSDPALLPLNLDFGAIARQTRPAAKTALKWRQTILAIVRDSLDQVELNRPGENDLIWRREARQRALNFTRLGFSEMTPSRIPVVRSNRPAWDIAAVATLGGAYRLLAKCNGMEPVQCEHILRRFLKNLALAYEPVCGEIELGVETCPIVLAPVKCRALILSAGMLIQGMMRLCNPGGFGGRLDIVLSAEDGAYSLTMELQGQRVDLLESPEFELAARLCGVFQSDLRLYGTEGDGLSILLTFPAADRAQ